MAYTAAQAALQRSCVSVQGEVVVKPGITYIAAH